MITKKVVLVLGAGASRPFQFPTGLELKTKILHLLSEPQAYRVVHEAGIGHDHIQDFTTALSKSGKLSVDAFLEYRTGFMDVGKIAIALALLPRESESNLFIEPSWYQYFFNRLSSDFQSFDQNSVSVLTFNYDRSLEHYLLTTMMHSFGRSLEECAAKMRSLPIIHLYGQLGRLPWEEEGHIPVLPFGADATADAIKRGAAGIRILHEDVTKDEQFEKAHELLATAERICFIGFGYHDTNIHRLVASGFHKEHQQIVGSAKNFTTRECEIIQRKFRNWGFMKVAKIDNVYGEALEFMHANCQFDDY